MKYIVVDWAGNLMFNGEQFDSFGDAEQFLCESFEENNMDYDQWRQEFYIEEMK